ncbi:MAG: Smr/MutS family protein [Alphaproteobacteria bacterium]|nr:Smr/MutS family protein [Alphaproteobacteria bacterium]
MKPEDINLWDELKKSVQPFNSDKIGGELPPRLKVRRAPLKPVTYCLDLHRMTVEEAYRKTLQFIEKHYKIGSKKIQIITGKGREGKGLIHSEFMGWLDTKTLKQYIREAKWTNDEGAVDLWLKKSK